MRMVKKICWTFILFQSTQKERFCPVLQPRVLSSLVSRQPKLCQDLTSDKRIETDPCAVQGFLLCMPADPDVREYVDGRNPAPPMAPKEQVSTVLWGPYVVQDFHNQVNDLGPNSGRPSHNL